eukprot:TRINITY_DN3113_c0_g1_i1.p1 TRINITY_DN3113_c0_g1~~TRINITY_DN3113_c0_g1_i1.p1  ORF type:complete len:364 (+),score=94.63 TRINITY_DN3113_c0_g1_i1:89-1093(+)
MAAPSSASGNSARQAPMQGSPAVSSSARRRQLRRAVAEIFKNVAFLNVKETGLETNEEQSTFNCLEVPAVDLNDYISQITGNDTRSERSWLYAIILADDFCRKAQVIVSPHSVHRIAACSLLLALKMTCDTCCVNGAVARIAGVGLDDLNHMERTWLLSVDFNLTICPDYYVAVGQHLGSILQCSRVRRSRGQRADCNLIPDEIRDYLPRRMLHYYQQGSRPPQPGEEILQVALPLSSPGSEEMSPASPPAEHPLYTRAAAPPRTSLPSSAAATAPPTLQELCSTAGAQKACGSMGNGACSLAAVAKGPSPTSVAPRPPTGSRAPARPRPARAS